MRCLNSPSALNTMQKTKDYGTVSIKKENGPHYDRGKKNHEDFICYNHRA